MFIPPSGFEAAVPEPGAVGGTVGNPGVILTPEETLTLAVSSGLDLKKAFPEADTSISSDQRTARLMRGGEPGRTQAPGRSTAGSDEHLYGPHSVPSSGSAG
jgi:hypothetical protein